MLDRASFHPAPKQTHNFPKLCLSAVLVEPLITCFRKSKKLMYSSCEREKMKQLCRHHISDEGGASLQLVAKTMVKQVVPLQPLEDCRGQGSTLQPMGRTQCQSRGMCPERSCNLWRAYTRAGSGQDL